MLIEKKKLENALKYLIRFTEKRTNILESVLINIGVEHTTLFATNTKIGAKIKIPVKDKNKKSICVPANKLYNILYLIDENEINFEFIDSNIKISTDSYLSQIKTYDSNLFPDLFNDIPDANISIDAELLRNALEKVLFATAKKSFRPEYENINFVVNEQGMSLCATNSFRLSYFKDKTVKTERGIDIIIPKQFILELLGMPVDEKRLKIGVTDDFLTVEAENIKLFTRLISGHFPDYKNIVKDSEEKKLATIDATKLLKAIKKVLFIAEKENYGVMFDFKENTLSVKSLNQEGEFAKETIEIEGTEERKIKLNGKMLLEYLPTVSNYRLDLFCESEDTPVKFIPQNVEYTLKYIQMPIN